MSGTIKGVFEDECSNVSIDSKLAKRLNRHVNQFINKNEDHVNFFGSNLLGVYTVRYLPSDREAWFGEVLDIDDTSLTDALYDLEVINEEFKRTSDVVNLSSVWLVHKLMNTKSLSSRDAHKAMVDVIFMLQVKFLTSVFAHYIKYPTDPEVAQAVYESLSRKFGLKQYGSWGAFLLARSEEIVSPSGIHHKTFQKFDDDEAIFYVITDIQGRMKEVVKKMMGILIHINNNKGRIVSTSSTVELDGEVILKDRKNGVTIYKRYIHSTIQDTNTFIRGEVVKVVQDAMHTMPEKLFLDTLRYCSINYGQKGGGEITELIDELMLHAFDFLSKNRNLIRGNVDLTSLVSRLRSLYMASRMSDPALVRAKELADSIVGKAVNSKNKAVLSSLRTGLELYIVLRAFSMNYYS